jgi:hypothetical protein
MASYVMLVDFAIGGAVLRLAEQVAALRTFHADQQHRRQTHFHLHRLRTSLAQALAKTLPSFLILSVVEGVSILLK